ncbi:MAG: hypothetical protein AAF578_04915 [Pseudomonadota bacterium]
MLASASLVYAACVALFEADPKRSKSELFSTDTRARAFLRPAATALFITALALLSLLFSFEKAVAIVIGLIAFGGIASILIATFFPQRLLGSGIALLAFGTVGALVAVVSSW